MQYKNVKLSNTESALFEMRTLFEKYGYSQYKVSKFEEYDLYAKNKAFLVSDSILTFTDTTGRLMALKPDVTLSIVKNTVSTNGMQKLYYSENVYRTHQGTQGFKEIMQTGLECVGDIDIYSTAEVLMLAARSLSIVSDNYILDISHMGFLMALLQNSVPQENIREILELIAQKNSAGVTELLKSINVADDVKNAILTLTSLYAPVSSAVGVLSELILNDDMKAAFNELKELCSVMENYGVSDKMYLDFSVINDMRYYNGIIFSGYIHGISDKVLSGGRYDNLLKRMKKDVGAIGFAFYLDTLEQLRFDSAETDVDVVVIYDENVAAADIIKVTEEQVSKGKTVRVMKTDNSEISRKEVIDLTKAGEGR